MRENVGRRAVATAGEGEEDLEGGRKGAEEVELEVVDQVRVGEGRRRRKRWWKSWSRWRRGR